MPNLPPLPMTTHTNTKAEVDVEESKMESSSSDDEDLGCEIAKGYAKLNELRKEAKL
jgi:hypothetical protein